MTGRRQSPLAAGRQKLLAWKSAGSTGVPPERDIFTSEYHEISVYVDPFTAYRIGAVVFGHEVAADDEEAHLAAISFSRRLKLATVVHAVGGKMLAAAQSGEELVTVDEDKGTQRVLERVDGFAVPGQAHYRIGLAYRGEEGVREGSKARLTNEELDTGWGLTAIDDEEARLLETRLDAIDLVASVLDDPGSPASLALMSRMALAVGGYQLPVTPPTTNWS